MFQFQTLETLKKGNSVSCLWDSWNSVWEDAV